MADYSTAYNLSVKQNEGGYRNAPWDAGGETYRGISRVYNPTWPGWAIIDQEKQKGPIPTGTVFNALEPAVMQFYRYFWDAIQGNAISNQSLANLVFDFSIQSGKAVEVIQESINSLIYPASIDVDNDFGPETFSYLNSLNPAKLYNAIAQARRDYYEYLLNIGIISPNDWQGILNRLARFPYLKEAKTAGKWLLAGLAGYGLYKLYSYEKRT